jgi:hypothetical protein
MIPSNRTAGGRVVGSITGEVIDYDEHRVKGIFEGAFAPCPIAGV